MPSFYQHTTDPLDLISYCVMTKLNDTHDHLIINNLPVSTHVRLDIYIWEYIHKSRVPSIQPSRHAIYVGVSRGFGINYVRYTNITDNIFRWIQNVVDNFTSNTDTVQYLITEWNISDILLAKRCLSLWNNAIPNYTVFKVHVIQSAKNKLVELSTELNTLQSDILHLTTADIYTNVNSIQHKLIQCTSIKSDINDYSLLIQLYIL